MDTLRIKSDWSEVNIGEWVEIGKIEENPELTGLNISKRVKVAAILSNKSEKEIGKMSGETWAKIMQATDFVTSAPKESKQDIIEIEVNGKVTEYMWHPELSKLTAGEQASIEQLLVDQRNNGTIATPGILAVLIRPVKRVRNEEFNRDEVTIEDFDVDNFNERVELFKKHLTVDKVWHQWAFFFDLGRKSMKTTPKSLAANQKKKGKKKKTKRK